MGELLKELKTSLEDKVIWKSFLVSVYLLMDYV